jgi:hypothetical protein
LSPGSNMLDTPASSTNALILWDTWGSLT